MTSAIPLEYLTSFVQANQALMQQLTNALLSAGDKETDFAQFTQAALVQQDYLTQMGKVWVNTMMRSVMDAPSVEPAKADRRFTSDAWRKNPYHDFVKQAYLVNMRYLNGLIERSSVDDKTRGRLRFFARQILDALSPSNYLATNPEAMQRAMETGGDSLAAGIKNLLEDLGKGRMSITDEKAFEVGRNLAVTSGAVVFENTLIHLIQYRPRTEIVGARPLVLIPPAINKFYVLDLRPENSFVRYAVEQGNVVFIVSWRNVAAEQGSLTWDDYLESGVMRAIDVALEITGADKVNALGFCVGGTLLGSAAAVMAARNEDKIESLTFLTTMLDFAEAGEIGLLIDEPGLVARERAIGHGGIMPGKELEFVFSTLRGNDLIWPYVVGNYLEGRQPDAFDILYWNADSTNLPGPMYCWYVRNTYLENNLRIPRRTTQCGVRVDLAEVEAATYVLASREDHIVPWQTAYRTTQLVSGEVRFVLAASGHIAGVINPPVRNKRNYWIDGALGPWSDKWLATAREMPGSWWSDWSAWLRTHEGERVPAPSKVGNAKYQEIEAAPGRYVKVRAA
jgi:polyhydroxyalkanoate synthase subunit PhaC